MLVHPENAPASWPNSSDSSKRVLKRRAVKINKSFIVTRGLTGGSPARSSSLPAPDSPVISTDVSAGATRRTSRRTSFICGDSATISGIFLFVRAICARRRWLSTFNCCFSAACVTRAESSRCDMALSDNRMRRASSPRSRFRPSPGRSA